MLREFERDWTAASTSTVDGPFVLKDIDTAHRRPLSHGAGLALVRRHGGAVNLPTGTPGPVLEELSPPLSGYHLY